MMKRLCLPLFLLLLFTQNTTVFAQARIISGVVKDKDTAEPLAGVSVITSTRKASVKTDVNGKYTIKINKDDVSLTFSYIGYNQAVINIKDTDIINIALAAADSRLEEIAVTESSDMAALSKTVKRSYKAERRSEMRITESAPITKAKAVGSRPDRNKIKPQSNLLTAGEWNDLDSWEFWSELMNNQEWSQQQSYWGFYTKSRVGVTLKNKQKQPLSNYTITALNNGVPVWEAQSNVEGRAELWPFLYQNTSGNITIEITDTNGQVLYKKDFLKTVRKLEITLNRPAQKIKNLDVLFMIDATGSMGDEIDYLKSELEDIIGRMGSNNLKTRTSLVFYRDHGDEYLIRDFGFDQDLNNVKRNLSNQGANGGGDFEEAVEEAMQNAIFQQQWTTTGASAKIMFMVLDAPPHHDSAKIKSIQKSVKEAAAKGITIIPVVASGIDKNTEFLMRFLAISTNGTYVFLTDDSGIGNTHLKPTTGSYQIEQLNALLNRLIKKYAGL